MKRNAIALAAGFGLLMAAQPAFAAAAAVTYSDLDLASEQGQKELDKRIESAARDVCGLNEKEVGSLVPSREARKCVRDAKKQIEKQVASLTGNKTTAGS